MTPLAGSDFRGEWDILAAFARKLLADRRNSYHEDDHRIRVMGAIFETWRRVDVNELLPEFGELEMLGATWAEMRADVEELAPRARARAESAARRGDVDAQHKRATDRTAALADCLLYYHRPPGGSAFDTPMIVHCQLINQPRRAAAAPVERKAA